MSDLTFSSLEVGRWYKIKLQAKSSNTTATADNVVITITHNGATIGTVIHALSQLNDTFLTDTIVEFKAAATTLTFVTSSMTNGAIFGDSTKDETWAQLSEIAPKQETNEW